MPVTDVNKDLDALTMTITTEFDADAERLWELWSDPRQLERWWSPPSHSSTFVEHELTVGARTTWPPKAWRSSRSWPAAPRSWRRASGPQSRSDSWSMSKTATSPAPAASPAGTSRERASRAIVQPGIRLPATPM